MAQIDASQWARLADPAQPMRAANLMALSDADPAAVQFLKVEWPKIPVERRRRIAKRMVEVAEESIEADFDAAFRVFLKDADSDVRVSALLGLWEATSQPLADEVAAMLATDPVPVVRAEAARALRHYAEMAALGKLRAGRDARLHDALLGAFRKPDEDRLVRCQALRTLAYWNDEETGALVRESYQSDDTALQASAVCAMGTMGGEAWAKQVLVELSNPDPEVRYEAAVAAGQMELAAAVGDLVELAGDPETEVKLAAIASLGQIGGAAAKRALKRLAASADPATREAAGEAIDELTLLENPLHALPEDFASAPSKQRPAASPQAKADAKNPASE